MTARFGRSESRLLCNLFIEVIALLGGLTLQSFEGFFLYKVSKTNSLRIFFLLSRTLST